MAIELFIGMPGTGKSFAMLYRVLELTQMGWKCFVSDIVGEWAEDSWRWAGQPPPIYNYENVKDDIEEIDKGCVIRFDGSQPRLECARQARHHANCWYVDDEIDMVAIAQGWADNPLKDFVHRGRHLATPYGIRKGNILGAARRLQYLHTDLSGMADILNIFRVRGSTTIKRLAEEGWLSAEQLKHAQTMENLHFFHSVAASEELARKHLVRLPKLPPKFKPEGHNAPPAPGAPSNQPALPFEAPEED